METKLENVLDSMMQNDNTIGALLADNQGLCFGSEKFVNFFKFPKQFFALKFLKFNLNFLKSQLAVKHLWTLQV